MHPSAKKNANYFFNTYTNNEESYNIVDIGSQDFNGSLKEICPKNSLYTGVDFVKGKNVDIVIDDPYSLPFKDNTFDIVISSSCFEHADMFWVTFLEILRILKPNGLFYLNTPSNGDFHYYPIDSWRFYPHAGTSLSKWGNRNGYNTTLLESFISYQNNDIWNDFVAIFLKDKNYQHEYKHRIIHKHNHFFNGIVDNSDKIQNPMSFTEDQTNIKKNIKRNIKNFLLMFKSKN